MMNYFKLPPVFLTIIIVRASTGVDPVTGRELSASERTAAAAWAAAGIVPILGPASKVAKGGKAVFAVSKGSKAATAPLTAFKSSTQAFTRVSHSEKSVYGLVSANGLSGFFFGQDLLGNEVTAEQKTKMLMMGSMLPFGAGMKMVKGNGTDVLGVGVKGTNKGNIVKEIKEIDFGKHIVKGKNGKNS
ncbi:pre-toxin TG domain-containing protein [Jeotgalibacillus sp. ET6]|uniref:pre-toxin TG domain-containing protein n=1 Tax=Jeotgalibacillus sp. ET6 TaxID=3037260 RepID=UPI0024181C9F|nr:pre-toxin TG domain-containing protein [Jeotgalibacillus sp. ET6]MDG5471610.1 pre-toxin TG domain-containing protein [Jeotgalibacillus sp. ET6]